MFSPMHGSSNLSRLDGRVAAVTGGNSGIGLETAKDLSSRGARVIILCRNVRKAEEAAERISLETGGVVDVERLDLASLRSVRECAKRLLDNELKIDVLVNNAGVMICPNWKTADGHDMQFGTNHLGHFLLTQLLMPLLVESTSTGFTPRIIIVSSVAHEYGRINWDDINWNKSYDSAMAYAQSKLANVMHGIELARRVKEAGIRVYIVHPGIVNTDLARHLYKKWYAAALKPIVIPWIRTPLQGAQTSLFCALDDSVIKSTGRYYSNCREKRPSTRALVREDQLRLWRLSEELTGLDRRRTEYDGDPLEDVASAASAMRSKL